MARVSSSHPSTSTRAGRSEDHWQPPLWTKEDRNKSQSNLTTFHLDNSRSVVGGHQRFLPNLPHHQELWRNFYSSLFFNVTMLAGRDGNSNYSRDIQSKWNLYCFNLGFIWLGKGSTNSDNKTFHTSTMMVLLKSPNLSLPAPLSGLLLEANGSGNLARQDPADASGAWANWPKWPPWLPIWLTFDFLILSTYDLETNAFSVPRPP